MPANTAHGAQSARGPLTVHPTNPRYFTDGSVSPDGSPRAVYLTGAHTWNNLVDMGRNDPPEAFDWGAYLDFLDAHNHNFIRMWAWDSTVWDTQANGSLGKDFVHNVAPLPWQRTGERAALDGKPRFDLSRHDPAYFQRLRNRVAEAGERGIYVSVMFFEGWGLFHGNRGRQAPEGWAWRSHPFHPANNANGVTADIDGVAGGVHRLGNERVNTIQEAYIRRVIDTVNDLDNVLYEVINEGGEKAWDWWIVDLVHEVERGKPKRHPVGITGHGAERLDSMLASPADWISPGSADGFRDDPATWDGRKVSLLDTDHVWGCGGHVPWVWRSFLRGHNPLFMDPYDGSVLGTPGDPEWVPIRQAMGVARRVAERVELGRMVPRADLASSGYCLADDGSTYIAYARDGANLILDLSDARGALTAEWIHPVRGESTTVEPVAPGRREFVAPFGGGAALLLSAQ